MMMMMAMGDGNHDGFHASERSAGMSIGKVSCGGPGKTSDFTLCTWVPAVRLRYLAWHSAMDLWGDQRPDALLPLPVLLEIF
jgi:hypothetical protein